MSLLAMNSLYEKRAMLGTNIPKHKRLTLCAIRTIFFQRENLNYIMVCSTQCTLFFQHIFFLYFANVFTVYYLWKMYVTKHPDK